MSEIVFSDPAMQEYFTNTVQPIVMPLFSGQHPIKEIRDRYAFLYRLIQQRYPKQLSVSLEQVPLSIELGAEQYAAVGCRVIDGMPDVQLFIPTIKQYETVLQREFGAWWKLAQSTGLTIGIMHECDHLAYGLISDDPNNPDKIFADESQAWAFTCEHTIRPLKEKYGAQIDKSDSEFYRVWLLTNRGQDWKKWERFIRSKYTSVARGQALAR